MSAPTIELADSQARIDTQTSSAVGAHASRSAIELAHPKVLAPSGSTSSRPATDGVIPKDSPSGGTPSSAAANERPQAQRRTAAAEQTTREAQENRATQRSHDLAGSDLPGGHWMSGSHRSIAARDQTEEGSAATIALATPNHRTSLADPLLALLADVREDAQRNRIANENRLRHLTRTEADEDGEVRGLGLDERHPDVARLASLVQMLADVEHQATLNLNRRMRQHPLGPWLKAQKGVGHGTLPARLLAILGDPYVNMQTGEVRLVSQLWSYCGHGDASRKRFKGMSQADLFAMGNPDAKMIVHLIAESCMKSGGLYREVYDARKAATEDRAHATDCVRCGPSGKPAPAGSPWSAAHRHADALRITGKAILRDLWVEAKRLHEEGLA